MCRGCSRVDHLGMSDRGMHNIEADLADNWVEDWAAVGLREIEALLAKHAAFLGYLEANEDTAL